MSTKRRTGSQSKRRKNSANLSAKKSKADSISRKKSSVKKPAKKATSTAKKVTSFNFGHNKKSSKKVTRNSVEEKIVKSISKSAKKTTKKASKETTKQGKKLGNKIGKKLGQWIKSKNPKYGKPTPAKTSAKAPIKSGISIKTARAQLGLKKHATLGATLNELERNAEAIDTRKKPGEQWAITFGPRIKSFRTFSSIHDLIKYLGHYDSTKMLWSSRNQKRFDDYIKAIKIVKTSSPRAWNDTAVKEAEKRKQKKIDELRSRTHLSSRIKKLEKEKAQLEKKLTKATKPAKKGKR